MSILHLVLLKAGPSAEDLEAALEDVRNLAQLKGVQWLHAGSDISVEGMQNGYTHAVVASFATQADRDAYLSHPAHIAAGARVGAAITDLTIVDLGA